MSSLHIARELVVASLQLGVFSELGTPKEDEYKNHAALVCGGVHAVHDYDT